jgi:hypothetical protein
MYFANQKKNRICEIRDFLKMLSVLVGKEGESGEILGENRFNRFE